MLRPLLFALPPEAAHALTLAALRTAHRLHLFAQPQLSPKPVTAMGLRFPNRIGIAAGLDKNATSVDAFGALGVGFIEIGTVTPKPQLGNPKPRLFRLLADEALINRMAFPNDGVATIVERLRRREFRGVCGVNIGKNASTPLSDAASDYIACLRAVHPVADYIAVNISSPNTAELRRLQHGAMLQMLLAKLIATRAELTRETDRHVPLLVKLSADLSDAELADAARIVVACGCEGIIAINTTVERFDLRSRHARELGGLSGEPLKARALSAVATIRHAVGSNFAIIGVGGIGSAADAAAMHAAGADLVQVYTGLIYRGPRLLREILSSKALG